MIVSPKAQADLASSFRYTFTVFTPTYNRAHTLYRVYESLQQQTVRDFEWLIVDDGSIDPTPDLVENWKKQVDFSLRYFQQANQGKHFAFNFGVKLAQGELFLLIDSDDAFVPRALERLLYHWKSIPMEKRDQFVGVTALCMDQKGRLIGDKYPQDILDSNALEIRYRYKVKGEKWGFNRTAVLRKYLFPDVLKKSYLPEGIIWNQIARTYNTRFINEVLRIYWIGDSSLVHGPKVAKKNAPGAQLQHLNTLNNELDWFRYAPVAFFRTAVHYGRFSLHAGVGIKQQSKLLENTAARILWVLMFPLAVLVYLKDAK